MHIGPMRPLAMVERSEAHRTPDLISTPSLALEVVLFSLFSSRRPMVGLKGRTR